MSKAGRVVSFLIPLGSTLLLLTRQVAAAPTIGNATHIVKVNAFTAEPWADRTVPYTQGLTLGQGFNSYLQTGCRHGAVTVKPAGTISLSTDYHAIEATNYEQLAKVLDISAAASIKAGGVTGSAEAKFLDRSEFEESLVTYVVKAEVVRRPGTDTKFSFNWNNASQPQEAYCDRFVSDFVTGGAFFARLSIRTTNSTQKEDIRAAAKIAVKMFGGEITSEVAKAVDTLSKTTEISTSIVSYGAPPEVQDNLRDELNTAGADDLFVVKKKAEDFLALAKAHDWKRYALLEKYEAVQNFDHQFQPLDYYEASGLSWSIFNDFYYYIATQQAIRNIDAKYFKNKSAQKTELQNRAVAALTTYRNWVMGVAKNPQNVETPPKVLQSPEAFYREVLAAVETNYIAQSEGSEKERSGYVDTRLHDGASHLFDFKAFSFGGIPGTTKLTFATSPDSSRLNNVFVGIDPPPRWRLDSTPVWVAYRNMEGVFDEALNLFYWTTMNNNVDIILQLNNDTAPILYGKEAHPVDNLYVLSR